MNRRPCHPGGIVIVERGHRLVKQQLRLPASAGVLVVNRGVVDDGYQNLSPPSSPHVERNPLGA
jgi:hypothetical protein